MGRDRVRIDGEMVTPCDVTRIVVGLASRITERLAARSSQRRLGRHSGGSGRFGTAPMQSSPLATAATPVTGPTTDTVFLGRSLEAWGAGTESDPGEAVGDPDPGIGPPPVVPEARSMR